MKSMRCLSTEAGILCEFRIHPRTLKCRHYRNLACSFETDEINRQLHIYKTMKIPYIEGLHHGKIMQPDFDVDGRPESLIPEDYY